MQQWDKGTIKGLGWSEDEKLLVVTEDGTVRCYYDLQGDFIPFTLGHVRYADRPCVSLDLQLYRVQKSMA